jgi:hypothetical protein
MKTLKWKQMTAVLGVVVSAAMLTACGQQTPPSENPPATTDAAPPATTDSSMTSSTTTTTSATSDTTSTTTSTSTSAQVAGTPCPNPPACGSHCSNYPFVPTDCLTTPYGPAKADVVIGNPVTSTNMLYCASGAYALCFFSGPPQPTGKNPAADKPLPCMLDGDVAKCTCQAYSAGPSFVDINGILNRGAYDQTIAACGADGSKCANIGTCGPDGKKPGCSSLPPAPVCQYVQNQNPSDPKVSLMPKADLVSTFSFAMDANYQLGSTSCAAGKYAGCMTAPCFFKAGHKSGVTNGEPIKCHCPVYDGPYQVGQSKQVCPIPPGDKATFVWSASNNVPASGGQ